MARECQSRLTFQTVDKDKMAESTYYLSYYIAFMIKYKNKPRQNESDMSSQTFHHFVYETRQVNRPDLKMNLQTKPHTLILINFNNLRLNHK